MTRVRALSSEMNMSEPDWLGQNGGALAAAFGSGTVAAYGFLKGIVSSPLKKRVKELEDQVAEERIRHRSEMAEERRRCEAMEARLVDRIQQLETLLLTHGNGALRQEMQRVVSEQRMEGKL